jgi:alkylhydroperoxidase/carboxymuconolactone decarboxylase family protein YurZ
MTMAETSTDELFERGMEMRRKLLGPRGQDVLEKTQGSNNLMSSWMVRNLFGEVFADDTIDLQTRSLCTISALIVLGKDGPLKNHLIGARRIGIPQEKLQALVAQMMWYGGLPAAIGADKVLREAMKEFEETVAKAEGLTA